MQKMLRVDPEERINAEQALSHPFFKEINEYQMINEHPIPPPVLKPHEQIKDSCIAFKMGKENLLTGKPDPIGPLNSSTKKNSFVNATNSPAHKAKRSKFKQN